MKINTVVEINASPGKVWFWLGDPENAMKWQTNVGRTEILHQTDNWIGTTFRETIEENGKGTEMEGVVTGWAENRLLSMHLQGRYNTVDINWELEEAVNVTILKVHSEVIFKGLVGLMSMLLRPMFRKNILKQLDSELSELKRLCEEP